MDLTCPKCGQSIENGGIQKKNYRCESCETDFQLQANCEKCGDKLTLLQACGAANLWCNSCNELKSKSAAIYSLHEV